MSPAHHRYVFIGFTLLIAGVTANVMVLQPAVPAAGASRLGNTGVESKAEADRRQRLALERLPPQAPTKTLNGSAEPSRSDAGRIEPQPAALSRVTAGGMQPTSTQIPMEQGPRRFARLRPDANRTVDKLPDAPDAEGDPETTKAVQRELTTHGYGPLTADGVPGLVTRAAIMAFEHDHQMALTGEATETVLARLIMGPSGAAAMTPDPNAGRVRSPQAELVIRTVQQSLAALGYQAGRVDGKPGEEIARAIREFELDEGLKPTGRVSAEVFSRLGRVVASAKPKSAP